MERGAVAADSGTPLISSSHASAIVELLDLTGVLEQARAGADGVVARLRADNPTVPAELWSHLATRIADRETLIAAYVPIYARYLPEPVVRATIDFYHSPPGSRLLAVLPVIQAQTRAAGTDWMQRVALELASSEEAAEEPKVRVQVLHAPVAALDEHRARGIRELLQVSGTIAEAQGTMSSIIRQLEHLQQGTVISQASWEQLRVRLTDQDELLRLWTPAYAQNLTDEEIAALTRFYRSPAGSRYAAALPQIQTASLAVGAKLGEGAVKRAMREVLGPLPQWRLTHPQVSPPAQSGASR